MALSDFKLIDASTVTSLSELSTGVGANTIAKAQDVNAIFRQNSLIGVGLLSGLNELGQTPSSLNPASSSLSDITTYFKNSLKISSNLDGSNNLSISIGEGSSNAITLPLNSYRVGYSDESTKLGHSSIGSSDQSIYLNNGIALKANVFENSNNISRAKSLVKNINGYTVPYFFNDYTANSSYQQVGLTVRQLQDSLGNPVTDLDLIKDYLKSMTGHKRIPEYDEQKPLYEYIVCSEGTDKDTLWKLEYNSTENLLAFKVEDYPYFAKATDLSLTNSNLSSTNSAVSIHTSEISALGTSINNQKQRIDILEKTELLSSSVGPIDLNSVISLSQSATNFDYLIIRYTIINKGPVLERAEVKSIRIDLPGSIGNIHQPDPTSFSISGVFKYKGIANMILYDVKFLYNYSSSQVRYDQLVVVEKPTVVAILSGGSTDYTDHEIYINKIYGYKNLTY